MPLLKWPTIDGPLLSYPFAAQLLLLHAERRGHLRLVLLRLPPILMTPALVIRRDQVPLQIASSNSSSSIPSRNEGAVRPRQTRHTIADHVRLVELVLELVHGLVEHLLRKADVRDVQLLNLRLVHRQDVLGAEGG